MTDERAPRLKDPLFVKISESPDAVDEQSGLQATPLQIKPGDTLTISGRPYVVEPIRGPDGAFAVRNKRDDLRGNLTAFDLLRRTSALPADCEVDDLCLRNPKNGDCMIELCHDSAPSDGDTPADKPSRHHLFARFDGCLANPHLENAEFDDVVVRVGSCMFGMKNARFETATGRLIPVVERSSVVDEPIERVVVVERLSLYEREILRRLLGITSLLLRGGKVKRLVTAFPRGAYYSFLILAAARGLISPETVLAWFDGVDKRFAMVRDRFASTIARVAPAITVEQYSFMDSACEPLRAFFTARLGQGAAPFDENVLLADVIEALWTVDPFARHLFSSGLPEPKTFRQLADLTYAVSNLPEMEEPTPRRKLVIGVYDPTENIMWNEVRKVRYREILERRGLYTAEGPSKSKLDSLSYIGIMPLEQVIFDVSQEYKDGHLGGAGRLVAMHDAAMDTVDNHLVTGVFATGRTRADTDKEE